MYGNLNWSFSISQLQSYYASQTSTSYVWSGGDGSVQEQQREDAATQLGVAVCNQQGSSDVTSCIQQAYDGLTVDTDIGNNGLLGGNWNWSYDGLMINGMPIDPSSLDGCTNGRCGTFNSMDFTHGDNSFHIDTTNVWSLFPVGALIHTVVDLFGGHTILSGGIPRPWI
jgi:hypothetical protein